MANIFEFIKEKKGILLLIIGMMLGLGFLLLDVKNNSREQPTEYTASYTDAYINTLEQKTEEIINKIKGVSEAKVVITLRNTGEQIFASDSSDANKKHVIVDDGLVCINEYMPEIEGVAVVCNGGNNAVVKEKITELLCSLLGIYSTHIYITE